MIKNDRNQFSGVGDEVKMRRALREIIHLVENWVDSEEKCAEVAMLKILNKALEVV